VSETPEARLKRLRMRSMRRGIREMDLILGGFAEECLGELGAAELDSYEALLSENDQDLYAWVSGQAPAPAPLAAMVARIAAHQARETAR